MYCIGTVNSSPGCARYSSSHVILTFVLLIYFIFLEYSLFDHAGINGSASKTIALSLASVSLADEARRSKPVENPERELFFWALLFGRKDLTMLFWRMGRDHIGGALTASRLWKTLAEAADCEEELDLSEELENSSWYRDHN